MKYLSALEPCEIADVDEVLTGVLLEVASGNHCELWPAMKFDPDLNQTRTGFFMNWERKPTPNDIAEVTVMTDALMGRPAVALMESKGDARTATDAIEWMRSGNLPEPKKVN